MKYESPLDDIPCDSRLIPSRFFISKIYFFKEQLYINRFVVVIVVNVEDSH